MGAVETRRLVYVSASRLPTEKAHGLQTVKMCQAFAALGHQVTLLHPRRSQPDPALRRLGVHAFYGVEPTFAVEEVGNVEITGWQRVLPAPVFVALFTIHALIWGFYAARLARARQADLYYTRSIHVAWWLTRLGLPTVLEAHVVPRRLQRRLLRRAAARDSMRLVAVLTPYIRDAFIEVGVPARRVAVFPDGADLAMFRYLPSREESRRRLELPVDREIIGYIGRFRTLGMEKGIPQLVAALPGILERRPAGGPLLLCVGGPREAVAEYEALAREGGVPDDAVRFMDQVPHPQVPLWIRACDVVTIPWTWTEFSAYFTSPLKLFEYMAAEVPIVASDLPSIREVLSHDRNALLTPPGDADALASAVCALLDDPGRAGRLAAEAARDVESYGWDRRAEAILAAASS